MDSSEAAKVVMERISRTEPEAIAKKIMGYIYFQGFPDQEMIRLALGPDAVIHSLIHQAKNARLFASSPHASPPISPPINPSPLSDPSFQFTPFSPPFRYWDPQIASDQTLMHIPPFKMVPEYTCLEDPLSEAIRSGPSTFSPNGYTFDNLSIRGARNAPSPMEHSVKMCHYFIKGFCKHGSNCRYLHGESSSASSPLIFGPNNSYEVGGDDQVFPPGSLDKLELEIVELLKSQKGLPVSIASLPTLYYAKYGKTIQAEGYLTESQRHGKAGYSLTKLLARLKNSIRLIDRPHGQHDVILAEEAPKYVDFRGERNDPGPIVSGSRQIFLTFPPESAFNEEDVSNHFSKFGPVQDVRIPSQQKRMFGFVTFLSAETVNLILSTGNPHYVCGARVLVKPYREKLKSVERKHLERFGYPAHYHTDIDSETQTSLGSSRMFHALCQEYEQALEIKGKRLLQLQLAGRSVSNHSCFRYSMNELKVHQEPFNYAGVVIGGSTSNDNSNKYPVNNCGDQESAQGLNLPDNPFASAAASSISAVI